ncbi:TonB-dependent receptor [Novosphingobium sp. P6W]|uniref:TonB-dependent receptor n=1 Tax=Novosphingobium sp. P6W TaxID=1609758 RepID=UPI0005C7A3DD|nr:TonB-dependent receptor [Novosphingobium sp. P6W]AXB80221.1 TonB-dependent receptor [Novosphingobium sp. P6W]
MKFRDHAASIALAAATSLVISLPAMAQATIRLDLPAQDLDVTLRAIARASGRQILIVANTVAGRQAPAVKGEFTPEEAVRTALGGSGIGVRFAGDTIIIGSPAPQATLGSDPSSGDIEVTGSRIKGSPIASPKITIGRQDILDAGFADIGSALRALPQNFAGGQNPGVGRGAAAGGIDNQNISGGSAVNLRGLGQDATLTLLNGARMTYGGFSQGIDISAIPIDAIERIDVVPDGASAVYGSDAVAGVVNVILRPSYEGLSVSSRLGTSTDGGYFSQQYSALGGVAWDNGGLYAGYTYRATDALEARKRSYTRSLGDPYDLYPDLDSHAAVARLTQTFSGDARFAVDGLFSRRVIRPDITVAGSIVSTRNIDRFVSLSPSLEVPIGDKWSVTVKGVYSDDRTTTLASQSFSGVEIYSAYGCYCNSLYSGEAYLEGGLFSLPGGTVRIVAGGGHRLNRFAYKNLRTGTGYSGDQKDSYGYAELFVPLVSDRNRSAFVDALSFTIAGRYDRFNRFGSIATPKLGIVYSPISSLDLKFSWGRSFKAPTLLQQYSQRSAALIDATSLVGSTDPAGTTALLTQGGGSGLKPERATTMSWTASFHPVADPGLSLDFTYFRVRYRDRVLTPITGYSNSLNPVYADYIVRNPTLAQVEATIAAADTALQNYDGVSYDLSKIAYIIDNHYTNVANQRIQSIDLTLQYRTQFASGEVSTSLNASWLDSSQRNNEYSSYFDKAGSIFNPPHYRARAGLGWEGHALKVFSFFNYTGILKDRRTATVRNVRSTVTMDTQIGYTFANDGPLRDLAINLSVENLFNTKPPYMRPAAYVEPYDTTNYSPLGRFVSLSISKTL